MILPHLNRRAALRVLRACLLLPLALSGAGAALAAGTDWVAAARAHPGCVPMNLDANAPDGPSALQAAWVDEARRMIKRDGEVQIVGIGDGTREYALAIGQRRADAVRQFLITRGIDHAKIIATPGDPLSPSGSIVSLGGDHICGAWIKPAPR